MSYHGEEIYDEEYDTWAPASGLPSGYFVSTSGRVRHHNMILKDRAGDSHGHIAVSFIDPNTKKRRYKYVHRIVMDTFEPSNGLGPIVRHLDDDPSNNDISNLAWGDQKDNHTDSVRNGNYRPFSNEDREKSYSKSRTPIVAINLATNEAVHFRGQGEAARFLGIPQSNIWKVLSGERKHAGGYFFAFEGGSYD